MFGNTKINKIYNNTNILRDYRMYMVTYALKLSPYFDKNKKEGEYIVQSHTIIP